jgi:anion-transporting  ArsA/GET3 family ATPase
MMQTTDLWEGNNLASGRWAYGPGLWTILVEREMRPRPMIVLNIGRQDAAQDTAEFVKNRVAMQQEHMKTIWREFDDSVRAIVPLFDAEVRGVPMLQRLCDAIYAADGVKPVLATAAARPRKSG